MLPHRPKNKPGPTRLKRLGGLRQPVPGQADSGSTAQLVEDLRHSQAELEIQNKALRFSQAAAEGASERFVTLFSSVPLALMVVDADGQILEYNARTLALMRPVEDDSPLNFLFPLVSFPQARTESSRLLMQSFVTASDQGTCELNELEFSGGSNGVRCWVRFAFPCRVCTAVLFGGWCRKPIHQHPANPRRNGECSFRVC